MANTVATVKLWDLIVGAIYWDETLNMGVFEYDETFIRQGLPIAPLQMPLQPGPITFPGLNRSTFKGLPACLADSLPDKFGNAVIDQWLTSQGRDPGSFNPVERLLYTGKRGMGALEYAPASRKGFNKSEEINIGELSKLAEQVLKHRNGFEGHLNDDATELNQLLQVGTSAGGARPKAIIAMDENGHVRSGQVTAPEGYRYWILKFDIDKTATELGEPLGYGRIEYAYSIMAKVAGINMTDCQLFEENGRAHFMTERFDRVGNGEKLHVQTLCAMAHANYNNAGAYSYEEALAVIRSLRLPQEDAIELFRRMVFNVLARNQDDHTKNISFYMDGSGEWFLSEAYDMTWSFLPGHQYLQAHQMTINGKTDMFELADLIAVGRIIDNFSDGEIAQVIYAVRDAVSQWEHIAVSAGVSSVSIAAIKQTHRLDIVS